jgi:hypothetical protein
LSVTPCKTCSEAKSVDEFYIDKRYGTPKQPCKTCWNAQWMVDRDRQRERCRRWENENPDKVAAKAKRYREKLRAQGNLREIDRAKNLWRLYRITPDDFAAMLEAQGGVCACCGKPPAESENLHVDHDHNCCPTKSKSCGKCIRGLVHNSCNRGIGLLGDDAESLLGSAQHVLSNRDLLRPMLAVLAANERPLDGIE